MPNTQDTRPNDHKDISIKHNLKCTIPLDGHVHHIVYFIYETIPVAAVLMHPEPACLFLLRPHFTQTASPSISRPLAHA